MATAPKKIYGKQRENFLQQLGPQELNGIRQFLACSVVGSPDTVRQGFDQLLEATRANELILVSDLYDPDLRLRSLGIAAGVWQQARASAT